MIAPLAALALLLATPQAAPPSAPVHALAAGQATVAAEATLDRMHEAASRADGKTYFALFAPGARFVGTDASERWDIGAFRAYTEPYFARGQGWTYRPRDRTLTLSGDFVWFDEILDHDSYGVLRGSGVLVRQGPDGDWKIAQYILSFAVPNDRSRAVVEAIGAE